MSQRDEQICHEVAEKQDVCKPRPLPCIHRAEIHYADVSEHKGQKHESREKVFPFHQRYGGVFADDVLKEDKVYGV